MPYLLNLVYLVALAILSPWLVYKALTTGKYRAGLASKLLGRVDFRKSRPGPTVWLHGVSVGEIHLLRQVVARIVQRFPDWQLVISSTTDTGYAEARKAFADHTVIYWPLDFSWAVKNALRTIRPDVVILGEGELWPNFLQAARALSVRLAVLNARMSPRSTARYRKVPTLSRWLLGHLDLILAQNAEYADNFHALGARQVEVTGNIKYDGVEMQRGNPRTAAMRSLLGIAGDDLVWVVGSTQAPEEQLALDIFRRARARFRHLRLILVPRQKERFDEAARIVEREGWALERRSLLPRQPDQIGREEAPVLLVDTIGELSAVWGLADVAFVGGSLDGRRGGQNMIEPAAYGAAVVFGPHVWNFKETATNLLRQGAALQVADAAEWEQVTLELLADPERRRHLGRAAQAFIRGQQGAVERSLGHLERLLTRTDQAAAA